MNKKLILFDIDKTLVDEVIRKSNPWRQAFNEVYGIDCEVTLARPNSQGMTMKEIAIETLTNKGLKKDEILDKLDLFITSLEKFYKKSLENGKISLFPKIPELLQKLSDKRHILGLITGNTNVIAFAKLRKAGIGNFFTVRGFGDDSHKREELIIAAIDRVKEKYNLEFDNKNIFVIGDTPKDIAAAKKFNLQTIGVATGIYSKDELIKSGADFVLDNLQNIKKVVSIIEG